MFFLFLAMALLMSTHSVCFLGDIGKISAHFGCKSTLFGPMFSEKIRVDNSCESSADSHKMSSFIFSKMLSPAFVIENNAINCKYRILFK